MIRMRIVAVGVFVPKRPLYLQSFDHEANGGVGTGTHTFDPAEAMVFPDFVTAIAFRNRVPKCQPWRRDGQPNRPLSAATIEFEQVPEGVKL